MNKTLTGMGPVTELPFIHWNLTLMKLLVVCLCSGCLRLPWMTCTTVFEKQKYILHYFCLLRSVFSWPLRFSILKKKQLQDPDLDPFPCFLPNISLFPPPSSCCLFTKMSFAADWPKITKWMLQLHSCFPAKVQYLIHFTILVLQGSDKHMCLFHDDFWMAGAIFKAVI